MEMSLGWNFLSSLFVLVVWGCFFSFLSELVQNREVKLVSGEETGCIEDTPADPSLRTDTVEFHTYRIRVKAVAVCERCARRFCKLSNTLILYFKLPKTAKYSQKKKKSRLRKQILVLSVPKQSDRVVSRAPCRSGGNPGSVPTRNTARGLVCRVDRRR